MADPLLQRSWDIGVLVLCSCVVVASILLTPSETAVSLMGITIPELCTFRRLSGLSCPGCGLTRSFTYMGHLEFQAAFQRHILGPPLYVLCAAQVPWRIWALWHTRRPRP